MDLCSPFGKRIECDGTKGTIKWEGSVPATKGIWYGIDWDDKERGKHDGTHNGIKYFSTWHAKSGSFVRSNKINLGFTFEEGLKNKYQNDASIEKEVTTELQRSIKARFVEVVGMEKVAKKQSQLGALRTAVLDGRLINGVGSSDLASTLPNLRDLDLSNCLLSSWDDVASIAKQLPSLRFLNVSGNCLQLPEIPNSLSKIFTQITHLILNHMIHYSWHDLLTCTTMFNNIKKLQMAHNELKDLGFIPVGVLESVEDIDIGVNSIQDWKEVCHLGHLPKLKSLNLNNCELSLIDFPDCRLGEKSQLFPYLSSIMVANNPLKCWKSVGELDKLKSLKELIISFNNEMMSGFYMEFTFARIKNLEVLNRTRVSAIEKRDNQLFYLRSFSSSFYTNGGSENPQENDLTQDFREEHPTFLALVKEFGAPSDDREHEKGKRLKDMKLQLEVVVKGKGGGGGDEFEPFVKSFLPSTRLSKVKMMIKRHFKINPSFNVNLTYSYRKNDKDHEITMENDLKDLQFYSISSGDKLIVRW